MRRILHTDYIGLCDCEFTTDSVNLPKDGSTVFVHMEHVYEFFRRLKYSSNKYTLVSANSDYSFVLQDENPVWFDMIKWTRGFLNINQDLLYNSVVIPPRCNPAKCKIDDMYSIKVYSHTGWTCNEIPENIIHWYSTNNSILSDRITHLPFGIPEWTDKLIESSFTNNPDRPIKFMFSCSMNNLLRSDIYSFYKNNNLVTTFNGNIPHNEFIDTLTKSEFVICPPGNGLDSFRVLEAIYCGATPIVLDTPENSCYNGLPVVKVDSFFYLEDVYKQCSGKIPKISLDNTRADLLYWSKLLKGN